MGRAVDARDEEGPQRTCAVTRVKGAPEHMLRFVAGPDGIVVPDVARRLPGRGVWLAPSREILAKAVTGKAFARAFKAKVETPPTMAADTEDMLTRDAMQWLSLANKAGSIVTGFAKVEAAIARGGLAALLHASDGGADGGEKLAWALGRDRAAGGERPPVIGIFDSSQLGLALGRPHVIHAALTAGSAAATLVARCRRLTLFRGLPWRERPAADWISRDNEPSSGAVSAGLAQAPLDLARMTNGQLTNGLGPGIANE